MEGGVDTYLQASTRASLEKNMNKDHPLVRRVLAAVLGLFGVALAAGGFWLVALGGSWYYVVAGLVLVADAWLLWQARAAAL
jgi:quinoprotein glucose dehydrogenase